MSRVYRDLLFLCTGRLMYRKILPSPFPLLSERRPQSLRGRQTSPLHASRGSKCEEEEVLRLF